MNKEEIIRKIVAAWEGYKNRCEAGDFRMEVRDISCCGIEGEGMFIKHIPSGTEVMMNHTSEGQWGWFTKNELRTFIEKF